MIQYQDAHTIIFESALFRTTSTLLWTDDLLLVVDPNWLPQEIQHIRQAFEKLRLGKEAFLLFTHSDYDHILGRMAFPELPLIASKAFQNNPAKNVIIEQITTFDDEYYIQRNYPILYPEVDICIDHDGQELQIGQTCLHFNLAPGHNADGIFTIVEQTGSWIAGDYLSNIEFPYIYHSSYAYEQTLQKARHIIAQFNIQLLIPGHGDVTSSKTEMEKRCSDSQQYIHRLREAIREDQPFDENKLWQQYHFPKVMHRFHSANRELIERELERKEKEEE